MHIVAKLGGCEQECSRKETSTEKREFSALL